MPNGISFPGSVVLTIPASKIEVRITKSNYQKLAQYRGPLLSRRSKTVMKKTLAVLAGLVALPVLAAAQKPVTQTESVEVTAKIEAIDKTARLVTLTDKDGDTETIYCGPEVKRFDD